MTILTKTVTLNPGESEEVTFVITPQEAGVSSVDVDGLTGRFRVIEAPTKWVSPTGHNDPQGEWISSRYPAQNAYDGDDKTFAMSKVLYGIGWSGWLELTHAPLYCNKVKYLLLLSTYGDIIDLEVEYNGAWHSVFHGDAKDYIWEEFSLGGVYLLTGIRIRFYRSRTDKMIACDIYEVYFGEV